MRPLLPIAGAAALLLSGCNDDSAPAVPGGGGEVIRALAHCEPQGLSKPLRQTTVFVDARLLEKTADAAQFAAKNAAVRDIILSIADPRRIQTSGVGALREKITIVVVPSDGSPAQRVFEGCPPGLSGDELAKARSNSSQIGEFFSGDVTRTIEKQADEFTRQLIGGLTAAGARGEGGGIRPTPVEGSAFLAGVRASKGLFEVQDHQQRLILVSDFARLAIPDPQDRQAGIVLGQQAGGSFNHSEIHLVAPPGSSPKGKEYLQGYFLAQAGNLASYSAARVGQPLAPPVQLRTFVGEANYPERAEGVLLRIGVNADGKLVGAWLTLRGTPDRATPMTGRMTCVGGQCSVESDDGGFAQVWAGPPSGAPQFNGDWPFAGMRNFTFKIDGDRISGRVYDDAVYIGEDTSKNSIAISGVKKS